MRGGRNTGFRIKELAGPPRPSGGGSGVYPNGRRCPGTFDVLHNDSIGSLRLRKGPYIVTLVNREIPCSRVSKLFQELPGRLRGQSAASVARERPDGHVHPRRRQEPRIQGQTGPLTGASARAGTDARPAGHTPGMADPHTDDTSTQRFARSASASERLREASFPLVMRGYDRHAVDEFVAELLALVQDLESRQTREGVVQKALDELGEETAGILQRAHETADDITARSRAQADARLQRAEREAEILRRDADEYAEQVIVDTRLLWEERQRLIEDIRQLADDVLGTADDAMERLKLPEQLGSAEAAAGGRPGDGRADWRRGRGRRARRGARRGRARLRRRGRADAGVPARRGRGPARGARAARRVRPHGRARGPAGRLRGRDAARARLAGAAATGRLRALERQLAAAAPAGLRRSVGCLARRAEALGEEAPDDARRLAARLLAHSRACGRPRAEGAARDAGPGSRGSAGRCRQRR